jgi:hypothetical protein
MKFRSSVLKMVAAADLREVHCIHLKDGRSITFRSPLILKMEAAADAKFISSTLKKEVAFLCNNGTYIQHYTASHPR